MPDNYIMFVIAVVATLLVAFVAIRTMRKKPNDDAVEPASTEAEAPSAEAGEDAGSAPADTAPAGEPVADSGDTDTLTHIKGLGPKAAAKLNDRGITRFAQIAGWSESDIAALDAELGNMAERIERDRWIEQAGLLAAGDISGFEAKFGKLG